MKLLELVLDFQIGQMMNIDEMQYGFVPGRGTTDAIFIVRQLQEKYLAAKKPLYFTFFDLEKAFDRVINVHHLPDLKVKHTLHQLHSLVSELEPAVIFAV